MLHIVLGMGEGYTLKKKKKRDKVQKLKYVFVLYLTLNGAY